MYYGVIKEEKIYMFSLERMDLDVSFLDEEDPDELISDFIDFEDGQEISKKEFEKELDRYITKLTWLKK